MREHLEKEREEAEPMVDSSGGGLGIVYRLMAELTLDPSNPRSHPPHQIKQIARSIEVFGFNVPVLIDAQHRVIAGHGRVLAAQKLGWHQVPTICLAHLNEAQRRAFQIADNRLTENGRWDQSLLGAQLKALAEVNLEFSLEVTGFEMAEIDVVIEGMASASEEKDDAADAVAQPSSGPPVSRAGDLWVLGPHRIFCGNALDAQAYQTMMEQQRAAMVITDPPYNVRIDGHVGGLGRIKHREFAMAAGEMSEAEFTTFLTQVLTQFAGASADGALHYLFMDWRHAGELLTAGRQVYAELKNLCVWVKDNAGMGSLYRSQHELVFVFKHGTAPHHNNIELGRFGRHRTNVWRYPAINSFGRASEEGNLLALHPTVKPVALVADAILDASGRNDVVLDPFVGSGTTVMAAERTGRVCYGMELDPQYVDTAIRRWQRWTGQQARHATSGRLFADLEAEQGGCHVN